MDWLAPNFKFYPCVLCKMSYHRFVGAAILLLANVFHCADCVGNRIIKDITCVKCKELGDGISQWVSHLNNDLDKVHCRLSSGWRNLLRGVAAITPFLNPSRLVGFSVEFFHGCFPLPRSSQSVRIELCVT